MNKKILVLVLAIVVTTLTYFVKTSNPICNYSNSLSVEAMSATAGYQRGYPLHFISDSPWLCNESGETGRNDRDFALLSDALNFAANLIIWFSVIFTASNFIAKLKIK